MILRILIWVGAVMAIGLVLIWVISGGIGKIIEKTKATEEESSGGFFSLTSFRLPWQPEGLIPDFSSSFESGDTESGGTLDTTYESVQIEYDELEDATQKAREFGIPSPFEGAVSLNIANAKETSPSEEYLKIDVTSRQTTPINIAGWSLQSALTGVRAYIPRGASDFHLGAVNTQKDIQLVPGAHAVVTSGSSPLGTSLRENLCTGYLNQLQTFSPTLSEQCPSPSESIPLSADNLNQYGDACIDFARSLSSCRAPLTGEVQGFSSACVSFIANTLSYNGCFDMYRYRANFFEDSWRIYLGASRELWRNSHDIIRLLDAEGRTVDAVTY